MSYGNLPRRFRFMFGLRHGRLKAVLRELARRKIGDACGNVAKNEDSPSRSQRWITGKWRGEVEAAFRDSLLEKEGWLQSGAALQWLAESARTG